MWHFLVNMRQILVLSFTAVLILLFIALIRFMYGLAMADIWFDHTTDDSFFLPIRPGAAIMKSVRCTPLVVQSRLHLSFDTRVWRWGWAVMVGNRRNNRALIVPFLALLFHHFVIIGFMHLLHSAHIQCNAIPLNFIFICTEHWTLGFTQSINDKSKSGRWSLVQHLSLDAQQISLRATTAFEPSSASKS